MKPYRPIYWDPSIAIDSELTNISGSCSLPIYCNQEWFNTVILTGYYCYIKHVLRRPYLGLHPVIIDDTAPDFTDLTHLYTYSLNQFLAAPLKAFSKKSKCDCNLDGAHELWCHRWEAY